jgi:DNA-binding NarL/FixJ family response regulator
MTVEIDRKFHLIRPLVDLEADGTLAAPRTAPGVMATLLIATRHEIAGAGIESLLQAAGHSVVARCSGEDDLLRSLEAYRPDIVILAENIVGQEGTKTVLRLRACKRSVAIIFLLDERNVVTSTDLLNLNVEGILLSAGCARSFIDCVESVHHGRKWLDPDLLHHLAMAEREPQIACSLTAREAGIAHLISQGLRNKEIARYLHLSEGTVKMHLHHIYEKLIDHALQARKAIFTSGARGSKRKGAWLNACVLTATTHKNS